MIDANQKLVRQMTDGWSESTRPILSKRSMSRVQPATLITYLKAIVLFVSSVDMQRQRGIFPSHPHRVQSKEEVEMLAANHAYTLPDGEVRGFHASFGFFFPWCDRSRLTAELKGIEKCSPSTPTTPMTYAMVIAMAVYARATLGLPQAVGVVIGFFGLLRSAEILRVRACDVMLRGGATALTTIRLLSTKSGREQLVQFAANSVPELMLVFLLQQPGTSRYQPLFGFRKYSELYKLFLNFRVHFRLIIHLTPHSLRAGGATHLRLQGWQLAIITEIGRWETMAVARTYIDVVFTLLPECRLAEAAIAPTHEAALRPMLADNFFNAVQGAVGHGR